VVGPVPSKKYSEIVFPLLSPNPSANKEAHFLKYPIYVGGNEEEGKFIPMGVRVMISSTTLQLQVKSIKLYVKKKVDTK
jgi:hypothetical protein